MGKQRTEDEMLTDRHWGIPGPGGSLGCCAVCGKGFVVESIMGTPVQSFGIKGIEQKLYGHDDCIATLKSCGNDWKKLPQGPLKEA